MTDLALPEHEEITLPHNGELINLGDAQACGAALAELRDMEAAMRAAKSALTAAIVEEARRQGSKTLPLNGGRKLEVAGGPERRYDPAAIEDGLRTLGMPEERIREIVKEEITYTVDARQAKRAAGANEQYAAVIESGTVEVDRPFYVRVRSR